MPPSLKQIKAYLKKTFHVGKVSLDSINETNVAEKFMSLTAQVEPIKIEPMEWVLLKSLMCKVAY